MNVFMGENDISQAPAWLFRCLAGLAVRPFPAAYSLWRIEVILLFFHNVNIVSKYC